MAGGITFVGRRSAQAGGHTRLAAALVQAARAQVAAAAEATKEEAIDNILANIASTYGARVGKERSEPLGDRARYVGTVVFKTNGVTIRFKVNGSADFMKKFGALNYGAGAHTIAPKTAPWLANPADNFFSRRPVIWFSTSGKFGRKFYEDGIETALQGFRGRL